MVVQNVISRRIVKDIEDTEEMESDSWSYEVPVRTRPNSAKFSIFRKVEDPVFNFINKLLNTGYDSTKMAVSRAKIRSEKLRELEDEVENVFEKLPKLPIKVIENMTSSRENSIR
ncbi:hypothetical protein NQ318_021696 [Aromia moschata]|uniref:Uncharacterized protein n=1 Tax=Aromia moschata TaxID=1265417 RepID=A0AAV8YDD3_9CUCU|nr:hypothetical protein NQ318_021696 [Aromia moschata]